MSLWGEGCSTFISDLMQSLLRAIRPYLSLSSTLTIAVLLPSYKVFSWDLFLSSIFLRVSVETPDNWVPSTSGISMSALD